MPDPDNFTARKETPLSFYRRLGGPQARSGNLDPPEIRSPERTDSIPNTLSRSILIILVCVYIYIYIYIYIYNGSTALVGLGILYEVTRSHSNTPHSAGLLWTSDWTVADIYWQHTKFTTDRHPCFRRESNLQSQQASGPRPTP